MHNMYKNTEKPPLPPAVFHFQPLRKLEEQENARSNGTPWRGDTQPRYTTPQPVYTTSSTIRNQPTHNHVYSNHHQNTMETRVVSVQENPTEHRDTNVQSVEKIKAYSNASTIELPPDCKLFQVSYIIEGVPRTLLVPMPKEATEEDAAKLVLPENFDSSMFETPRPNEQLPVLAFPDGTSPNVSPPKEEEAVVQVNPKQFLRILKRREMRLKLEAAGRLPNQRQAYLYESRHRHAQNRKRSLHGRFFVDETKATENDEIYDEEDEDEGEEDENVTTLNTSYAPPRLAPITARGYPPPNMHDQNHQNGYHQMMTSDNYNNHIIDQQHQDYNNHYQYQHYDNNNMNYPNNF